MTTKTRTVIFLISFLLFLVVTPGIVFYTQGYRFDAKNRKVVQTGGIFIKATPQGAEVYLNGRFKKKTDFLFGQMFIGNLLPGTYEISVKKDGYIPWQKELEVQEKQLTTAQHIFLFPTNPSWIFLKENVQQLWFSPTEKRIVLKMKEKGEMILGVADRENKNGELPFSARWRKLDNQEIEDIIWSPDEKHFLIQIKAPHPRFLLAKNGEEKLSPLPLKLQNIAKIFWHPQSQNTLLVLLDKGSGIFDVAEGDIQQSQPSILLKDVRAFAPGKNEFFWITAEGHLMSGDFAGISKSILTKEPLPLEKSDKLSLLFSKTRGNILVRQNDRIFAFRSEEGTFEKIPDASGNIIFSPDSKRAVHFNAHEIFVFYLEQQEDQPRKEAFTNVFLTRIGEKITSLQWLSNRYLLLQTDSQKIKIVEIDDRNGLNILEVPTPGVPQKILFSSSSKKLYLLNSGGDLFVSKEKFSP